MQARPTGRFRMSDTDSTPIDEVTWYLEYGLDASESAPSPA
jgi:hypothetical protein